MKNHQSLKKSCIVVHSGGMDSSICLAMAVNEYGAQNVLSLGFDYGQRHANELELAQKISKHFKVDRVVLSIDCLGEITQNALTDNKLEIDNENLNTLVVGRNGLMARLAAIHAQSLGANEIWMGVIEVESANSGYRDCSRNYMNLMENILKIDLDNDQFKIMTPIIDMDKKQTMDKAFELGALKFLLENTITCYEGEQAYGCGTCPACLLRNEGISKFLQENPDFDFSYKDSFLKS